MNTFPRWYVLLCYLAIPLSGIGVDIYTPSLPNISQYFHISPSVSELSLSVYLIGFGIMQLCAGPLTDRYGRRPILLFSLVTFFLVSLFIAHSTETWHLITGRCLQGITGAGIAVPGRAILSDISDKETYKKRINYMIFAWGMGPILAPWIGSHLQAAFGWKFNFYFLAAYTFILLVLTLFTQETHIPSTQQKQQPLLHNYKSLLKNPIFIPVGIAIALAYNTMVSFGMVGPFLIQQKLNLSVLVFGRCALSLGLAWLLGSLIHRRYLHVDLRQKLSISIALLLLLSVAMCLVTAYYPNSLWSLIIPVFSITLLGSFIFSSYVTDTLSQFQHMAGSANAALFAMLWFFIGVISTAISKLPINSLFVFSGAIFIITLASLFCYQLMIKPVLAKR